MASPQFTPGRQLLCCGAAVTSAVISHRIRPVRLRVHAQGDAAPCRPHRRRATTSHGRAARCVGNWRPALAPVTRRRPPLFCGGRNRRQVRRAAADAGPGRPLPQWTRRRRRTSVAAPADGRREPTGASVSGCWRHRARRVGSRAGCEVLCATQSVDEVPECVREVRTSVSTPSTKVVFCCDEEGGISADRS